MGLEQPQFDPGEEERVGIYEVMPPQEKPPGKIIEFPKRNEEEVPPETPEEKVDKLERLKGEILEFPKPNEEPVQETEAQPQPEKLVENDDKALHGWETFERYRACEYCGGKGRKHWYSFSVCPVCRGFGRVVIDSYENRF